MIQYRKFADGCFVLHGIKLNGHKYSCWYGRDGKPFSAERFHRYNDTTYHVDLSRQHEVARQLERRGRPYVEQVDTTGKVVENQAYSGVTRWTKAN